MSPSRRLPSISYLDPTTLSEASLARYFEQQSELQESITASAGSLLSPEQQQVFAQNQQQLRAMQKMSLKMAQQMFQGEE